MAPYNKIRLKFCNILVHHSLGESNRVRSLSQRQTLRIALLRAVTVERIDSFRLVSPAQKGKSSDRWAQLLSSTWTMALVPSHEYVKETFRLPVKRVKSVKTRKILFPKLYKPPQLFSFPFLQIRFSGVGFFPSYNSN